MSFIKNVEDINSDSAFIEHSYPLSDPSSNITPINGYNDKEKLETNEPGNLQLNDEELQF